jgi:hypothetical protein
MSRWRLAKSAAKIEGAISFEDIKSCCKVFAKIEKKSWQLAVCG